MSQRIRRFSLGLAAVLTAGWLSACQGNQPVPLRQSNASRAILNSFGNDEPAFGNTATNIQRIQSKPFSGKVRFVVLGDNRNSSPFSSGGDKVYRKVIDKVNAINPDFAMNLGDFTFDALRPHWNTFEKITSGSRVPYLTVVGNHDVLFGRAYYETRYTPPNVETGLDDYVFEYGNNRFIILDTANFTLTERQFQWLEKQLQTSLNTMVFSHTPPSHGVWEHKLAPSPEVTQRWMELHKKYNVGHVFLGHIHLYDQRNFDGINYTISGGGGAPLDKAPHYGQGVYHVVLVEVEGNQIRTQMVPIETRIETRGPTVVSDGITPAQMQEPGVLSRYPQDYIPPEEQ